jgi:hypothetical protein
MPDDEILFRFPDPKHLAEFTSRYPAVLRALDAMAGGFAGLIHQLKQQDDSEVNNILFLLFGASWREFDAILVLALNGYGSGAMKLLRALYERTVTTQYLMKHPNKVKQFKAFTHVHGTRSSSMRTKPASALNSRKNDARRLKRISPTSRTNSWK